MSVSADRGKSRRPRDRGLSDAHRDRLGRHQDRGDRARRDGASSPAQRVATPKGDYDGCLAAIGGLVRSIESEHGPQRPVGIGIPGAISPATGLHHERQLDLEQRPAARPRPGGARSAARCGSRTTPIASRVSEAARRGGRRAIVWGVIIGTGAAPASRSRAARSAGATRSPANGATTPCPGRRRRAAGAAAAICGRQGCIETFVSGTGFERDYARERHDARGPAIVAADARRRPGAPSDLRAYLDRLARGDRARS